MKTNKGFATILGIIIGLLIIGGGAYIYLNNDNGNEDNAIVDDFNKWAVDDSNTDNETVAPNGKSSFSSQEEQTAARERTAGITNRVKENGILFTLEPQYPYVPKYKLPINVTGYVSDVEKWGIFEGKAGSVSVYDSNNRLLGSSPLNLRSFSDNKWYFNVVVGDREWMSNLDTGNGYVVVRGNSTNDLQTLSEIVVPIDFYLEENDTYNNDWNIYENIKAGYRFLYPDEIPDSCIDGDNRKCSEYLESTSILEINDSGDVYIVGINQIMAPGIFVEYDVETGRMQDIIDNCKDSDYNNGDDIINSKTIFWCTWPELDGTRGYVMNGDNLVTIYGYLIWKSSGILNTFKIF